MGKNVALEKSAKKKFEKAISGVKAPQKNGKHVLLKKRKKIQNSRKTGHRAVVYIGHIPHGFYEKQMLMFFKQFGKVTNVRVARSRKNGASKGYGFVEFQEREVAEIVAETMNNYLMDKRLLKAECIPDTRKMSSLFRGKNWVEHKYCPGIIARKKSIQNMNKTVDHKNWIKYCKKQLTKIRDLKKKLNDLGFDFNFVPSDVPNEVSNYDSHKENVKILNDLTDNEKELDGSITSNEENTNTVSSVIATKNKQKGKTAKNLLEANQGKKKKPDTDKITNSKKENKSQIKKDKLKTSVSENESLKEKSKNRKAFGGIQKEKKEKKSDQLSLKNITKTNTEDLIKMGNLINIKSKKSLQEKKKYIKPKKLLKIKKTK